MSHNVLVASDLHLTLHLDAESRATDAEFARFLDHYREHRPGGLPWRLVLAGDTFDFVYPDMELFLARIPAGDDPGLPPRPGASPRGFLEHWDVGAVAWRLAVTMDQHAPLFEALGRFLAAGHTVAILKGNHDVELHWARLQRVFLDRLSALLERAGAPVPRSSLAQQIRFHPWFYLEKGRIWVEHGNQYDEFNALPDFLDPALVTDPDRAFAPMGSRLTHYLTNAFPDYRPRPVPGAFPKYLKETGQSWSRKYISRSLTVLSHSLVHAGLFSEEGWTLGMGRADEALRQVEADHGLPVETLVALQATQAPPVTAQDRWVYNRFLLDRAFVLLFGLAILGLGLAFGLLPPQEPALLVALLGGLPLLVGGALVRLKGRRRFGPWRHALPAGLALACAAASALGGGTLRGAWLAAFTVFVVATCVVSFPLTEATDLRTHLVRVARRIALLADVPVVVLGHHHQPVAETLPEGGTYLNAGGWVNSGLDGSHAHVVLLEDVPGHPSARLVVGRSFLGGAP